MLGIGGLSRMGAFTLDLTNGKEFEIKTLCVCIQYEVSIYLTPKGPLSLQGTNGISGRYLRSQFLSEFFETFFEDRKIDKLHGNIIYFPIGAWEQKLYPNKFKTRETK